MASSPGVLPPSEEASKMSPTAFMASSSPTQRRISPSAHKGTPDAIVHGGLSVPAGSHDDAIDLGPPALGDPNDEEIAELESDIMQRSRTMEDFARIISEWRTDRERTATAAANGNAGSVRTSVYGAGAQAGQGSSSQTHLRVRRSIASLSAEAARSNALDMADDGASQYSYDPSSVGDPDEHGETRISPSFSPTIEATAAGGSSVHVRCTCCCGRGTRRCKRARRATREWGQMESDLRLAAQIGQALLRRSDALQAELDSKQDEHGSRINSLMKKLSLSIKEATHLSKRFEQSELNLEACEASNRALVRELDDVRRELARLKGSSVRNSGLEMKLARAEREAEDAQQEAEAERKHSEQMKAKMKRLEKIHEDLSTQLKVAKLQSKEGALVNDDERARRKEEVRKLVEQRLGAGTLKAANGADGTEAESSGETSWMEGLVSENDSLAQSNKQLKEMLDSRNEEVAQLREELIQKEEFATRIASVLPASDTLHLRMSDLDSSLPLSTALSDELVDPKSLQASDSVTQKPLSSAASQNTSFASLSERGQQTPMLLSPQMATNASLPSGPGSPLASSVGTAGNTTEATSDALSSSHPGNALKSKASMSALNNASSSAKRETRTAQLNLLLDTIQRIFSRLSMADVDTLAKRLQRQKLAGDVGHLARTTVNGILRDVDGLRDHFRRAMENEAKGRDAPVSDNVSIHSRTSGKSGSGQTADSESLVARKEFFALIKLFKDLFLEMARLRNAINEVSLQPQHAARILQEQLGLQQVSEDKGMGGWFGRLLSGSTGSGAPTTTNSPGGGSSSTAAGTASNAGNSSSAATSGMAALGFGGLGSSSRPGTTSRTPSGSQPGAPTNARRATAEVVPSAIAIEVKGMHTSEQLQPNFVGSYGATSGRDDSSRGTSPQPDTTNSSSFEPAHARPVQTRRQASLSRTQSRNLSGLFVGSMIGNGDDAPKPVMRNRMASEQGLTNNYSSNRLSRIVDDDEVSIHHQVARARTLRPRNLSDSSMHTTYLEDEPAQDAVEQQTDSRPRAPRPSGLGLMSAAGPTPAAISRVITPSTLSLSTNSESARSNSLLGSLAAPRSVAKAFGYLSSATTTTATGAVTASPSSSLMATPTATVSGEGAKAVPPSSARVLRTKSSTAQLSLASASGVATVDRTAEQ